MVAKLGARLNALEKVAGRRNINIKVSVKEESLEKNLDKDQRNHTQENTPKEGQGDGSHRGNSPVGAVGPDLCHMICPKCRRSNKF